MRIIGVLLGCICVFWPVLLKAELPRQVMIEVKVVEMTYDTTRELGIDWTYQRDTTTGAESPGADLDKVTTYFPPPSYITTGWKGSELIFKEIKIGYGAFDIKLQAMIENGQAELLSNPKIVTIENNEANIITGEKVPYQSATVVGTQVVLVTQFLDVGVKLKVTPKIQEQDYILLDVSPEVSNVSRSETVVYGTGQTVSLPVLSMRNAQTKVLVKDSQTFVLGGLFKNDKTKTVRGVPILCKIPILGFFFRYSKDVIQKRELIFFITPRIVRPEGEFFAPAEQKQKNELEQQSEDKIE